MYKSATKCNETIGKWCKNKHGALKIIDTFETYQIGKTFSSTKSDLQVESSSGTSKVPSVVSGGLE
jgi:hypothetical protein